MLLAELPFTQTNIKHMNNCLNWRMQGLYSSQKVELIGYPVKNFALVVCKRAKIQSAKMGNPVFPVESKLFLKTTMHRGVKALTAVTLG